ncbi:MAG: 16S rRNA (cytosine(967)-C(5))-methyltransferase RsmB, partial [Gammaproteobacteria bacterium]|nr:16S rRNA (cytosine(967)-C(5))-methyltransferase RsmB [Gammaproteobacteria bacterium]
QVDKGRSLSAVLPEAAVALKPSDKPLLQELCFGVLRWHSQLDFILQQLLQKPLRKKDRDVLTLLMLGVYQLMHMRIPPHAVVSETVKTAISLKKVWAKGMLNAVLRNFIRQQDDLLQQVKPNDVAHFSHPSWFVRQLKNDWPHDWQAILDANNQRPPMWLRVNLRNERQKNKTELSYQEKLANADIAFAAGEHGTAALRLLKPKPVEDLPGFSQGDVSVQDAAAQLAASLLDVAPNMQVLDACAAPGGKTAHILELCPEANVTAVDIEASRVTKIKESLERLSLSALCITADVAEPDLWSDGKTFQRILLDAPCSATGVIRRHPDIKLLRREDDITALVALQERILEAVWPLLRPGGILLYATCSVLKQENQQQMERFFKRHTEDAQHIGIIDKGWGVACDYGRQVLTGRDQMDGFYFAKIQKTV